MQVEAVVRDSFAKIEHAFRATWRHAATCWASGAGDQAGMTSHWDVVHDRALELRALADEDLAEVEHRLIGVQFVAGKTLYGRVAGQA